MTDTAVWLWTAAHDLVLIGGLIAGYAWLAVLTAHQHHLHRRLTNHTSRRGHRRESSSGRANRDTGRDRGPVPTGLPRSDQADSHTGGAVWDGDAVDDAEYAASQSIQATELLRRAQDYPQRMLPGPSRPRASARPDAARRPPLPAPAEQTHRLPSLSDRPLPPSAVATCQPQRRPAPSPRTRTVP